MASKLMMVGGIVEILIAILHFVWPYDVIRFGEYSFLSKMYQDLLILSSISIGLCLFIFGVLAIYFSKKLMTRSELALFYCISQGILWVVRAIFELIYPVKVPIYFIANPTFFIFPLALLLGMIFLAPLLIFKKKLMDKQRHVRGI